MAGASAAAEAATAGPLSRSRSQLLQYSRALGGGGRPATLSSPLTTAAAAAQLAAERRRATHSAAQHSRAWENLPGDVASLSYAATAPLKANPLPALAAVAAAAGQQRRKQHAVQAEPGVLTQHASQLPHRPMSESGFSLCSGMQGLGSGRYPGLRAEESRASTAATMRQLQQQQADTQQQIARLLCATNTAAAGGGAVGAAAADAGGPELHQAYSTYSIGQGQGFVLPEASGYSAASAALGPNNSLVLVQRQQQQPPPQLYAQCSNSSAGGVGGGGAGSFLAPVAVTAFGSRVAHAAAGHQQVFVLPAAQVGVAAALPPVLQQQQGHPMLQQGSGIVRSSRNYAQMRPHMHQQQQQYLALPPAAQQWEPQGLVLLQEGSSVGAGAAQTARPTSSSAKSCMELGCTRAADVGNIVLRAKAKAAAARQQQQLHQHQQQQGQEQTEQQGVLRTPVHHQGQGGYEDDGAQPKGAAAMLVGGKGSSSSRPPAYAASTRPAGARAAVLGGGSDGAGGASAGAKAAAAAEAGTSAGNAAASNSLAAAVRDGDRVLSMLHEYKELSQLDRAVKSRMMQLLHNASATSAPNRPHQGLVRAADAGGVHAEASSTEHARVDADENAGNSAAGVMQPACADAPAGSATGDQAAQHQRSPTKMQQSAGQRSDQQQERSAPASGTSCPLMAAAANSNSSTITPWAAVNDAARRKAAARQLWKSKQAAPLVASTAQHTAHTPAARFAQMPAFELVVGRSDSAAVAALVAAVAAGPVSGG